MTTAVHCKTCTSELSFPGSRAAGICQECQLDAQVPITDGPPVDHPAWEPVDRMLDDFRALMQAGEEDQALRLLDAAEALEQAICATGRESDFGARTGCEETTPPTQEVSA